MTPQELKDWLSQDRSIKAGWSKADGETVGHERLACLISLQSFQNVGLILSQRPEDHQDLREEPQEGPKEVR